MRGVTPCIMYRGITAPGPKHEQSEYNEGSTQCHRNHDGQSDEEQAVHGLVVCDPGLTWSLYRSSEQTMYAELNYGSKSDEVRAADCMWQLARFGIQKRFNDCVLEKPTSDLASVLGTASKTLLANLPHTLLYIENIMARGGTSRVHLDVDHTRDGTTSTGDKKKEPVPPLRILCRSTALTRKLLCAYLTIGKGTCVLPTWLSDSLNAGVVLVFRGLSWMFACAPATLDVGDHWCEAYGARKTVTKHSVLELALGMTESVDQDVVAGASRALLSRATAGILVCEQAAYVAMTSTTGPRGV